MFIKSITCQTLWQTYEDEMFQLASRIRSPLPKLYAIVGLSYDKQKSIKAEDWNVTPHRDFDKADENAWNPMAGFYHSPIPESKPYLRRKTHFPSLKDRYSYPLGTAIPNADLEPERARNYELGYQDVLFKEYP